MSHVECPRLIQVRTATTKTATSQNGDNLSQNGDSTSSQNGDTHSSKRRHPLVKMKTNMGQNGNKYLSKKAANIGSFGRQHQNVDKPNR